MLIVQKLYLGEFVKVFALLWIGISSVFALVGMLDKVGEFLSYKPHFWLLIKYYLLSIPKLLHYLLPMSALLSGLYVFSSAVKKLEITVIKSSAGSVKRIFRPFITVSVVLTTLSFFLGEFVVPYSVKQMNITKHIITKKERRYAVKDSVAYLRGKDGSVIRVQRFIPDTNTAVGVTILSYSQKGLHKRIDAQSASWLQDKWLLKAVTLIDIDKGTFSYKESLNFDGLESPKVFVDEIHNVEEMNITELFSYEQRLREAGFKNVRLTTYINSRLSYSLVNLFMTVLAMALALGSLQFITSKFLHGSLTHAGAVSASIGLVISVLYWMGYTFFLSLGYAGTIAPFISPWIMPAMMSVLSFYLYRQIPE